MGPSSPRADCARKAAGEARTLPGTCGGLGVERRGQQRAGLVWGMWFLHLPWPQLRVWRLGVAHLTLRVRHQLYVFRWMHQGRSGASRGSLCTSKHSRDVSVIYAA